MYINVYITQDGDFQWILSSKCRQARAHLHLLFLGSVSLLRRHDLAGSGSWAKCSNCYGDQKGIYGDLMGLIWR
jgi:hypothetical protein